MKKLFLALALAASMSAAYAQSVKSDADIQKAIDKASATANDAKKGLKAASWMKLGDAYMNAYQNPTAAVAYGMDKTTFGLAAGEKPKSVEVVNVDGQAFEKQVLSRYNAYFNATGQLVVLEVTKPSYAGDALAEAAKAYITAFERDAKKAKDVDEKLQDICGRYETDAYTAYSFKQMDKAAKMFKGAADVSMQAPCSKIDTNAVYNTAYIALSLGDFALAKEYYNKCLALGHTANGSVFASLSQVELAQGDTLSAKTMLVDGLKQYPDNASILTSLINLYLNINEDPEKIVELLDEAKKQMPDNPSLYYVEGNIYTGIKNYVKAHAAYAKSSEVDPKYDMAYYGDGVCYLKEADDIAEEMNNLDVREYKKYDVLQAKLEGQYKTSVEVFEKCYEISENAQVKEAAADYLKRVCFLLRNSDPKYQAAYEKYEAILNGNK